MAIAPAPQAVTAAGVAKPAKPPIAQAKPAKPPIAQAKPAAPTVVVTVGEGQTLWSLSRRYGTTVDEIVTANGLGSAQYIRAGAKLVIPKGSASGGAVRATLKPTPSKPKPGTRVLTVRIYQGQTLWDVSQTYGVPVAELAAVNGLRSPDYVRAGQRLRVPVSESAMSTRRVAAAIAREAGEAAASAVKLAQAFIWPARGRLTSRFGWRRWRHHDGIDIGAPYGAPITAALDGVVVYAGWYYAYGRTVIIDHGEGLRTLYGHASRTLVRPGQKVSKGQLIAKVGSTGRSTGPHVHFEVRINGRPVNPLKYL